MSKSTLLIAAGAGALVLIFFMGKRSAPGGDAGVLNPKGPPATPSSMVGDVFNTGIGIVNDVLGLIERANKVDGAISSSGGSPSGDGVLPPTF